MRPLDTERTAMPELELDPRAVLDQFHKNDVTHVVWLPDSETSFLYD